MLGSVAIKRCEYDMLFLNSKGGRTWRQANRNRLLELARKSITEPPKPRPIKNRDTSIALGAVASVLSQYAPGKAWPTPTHLEFLFLDLANGQRPSIAREFWPEFNEGLDEIYIKRLAESDKLAMRWNYLARIWPESTTDMFVDCYMKAPAADRQRCLLGRYRKNVGMPGTLPPLIQLEILTTIQGKLAQSSAGIAEGIYGSSYIPSWKTKNELETVDVAIGKVNCPGGAEKFVDQLSIQGGWKDPANLPEGFEGYERAGYLLSEWDQKYSLRGRRWFDDRLNALAKDEDSQFRLLAARAIGLRPVPQYMPVLEILKKDSDEEVRAQANEVAAFLDELTK